MSEADRLIELLDLKPHPEGGHFRETFQRQQCQKRRAAFHRHLFPAQRPVRCHRWHRVDAAEVWHFYRGAPLELKIGKQTYVLGNQHRRGTGTAAGRTAACLAGGAQLGDYTLVGCTVAPGFEFSKVRNGAGRLHAGLITAPATISTDTDPECPRVNAGAARTVDVGADDLAVAVDAQLLLGSQRFPIAGWSDTLPVPCLVRLAVKWAGRRQVTAWGSPSPPGSLGDGGMQGKTLLPSALRSWPVTVRRAQTALWMQILRTHAAAGQRGARGRRWHRDLLLRRDVQAGALGSSSAAGGLRKTGETQRSGREAAT